MPGAFGGFVNNLSPANLTTPGVYVFQAPTQQVTPVGPAVGVFGIIGTAQWGPFNTPLPFNNPSSGYALFGPNTTLPNAIMRDAYLASSEANQFVASRVGDGTQTAATIVVTDASSATVGTFTAQQQGTLPNGVNAAGIVTNPAQVQFTLASGTASVSPVIQTTITFPNNTPERYNVVAYASLGGAFNGTAFKANLATAINVGTVNGSPSPRWTFTAGSSTLTPVLGTAYSASGGTDGVANITTAVLIGADATVGRTGIFALRGAIQGGQWVIAGFSDTTQAQTMAAFNKTEGTRAAISFPLGTQYATAIGLQSTNSTKDPTLDNCIDWIQTSDPFTGQLVFVAPAAKVNAIISSLDFDQDPLNKPKGGGAGLIIATERSLEGPISVGEAQARYAAGLQYVTNPIPRGPVWGLPSGKASDGVSNIADVRASNFIGLSLFQIYGPLVGDDQTAAVNDSFRNNIVGVTTSFFSQLLTPRKKIASYSFVDDTSNNSPTTVAQGINIANLAVTTKAGVTFILVNSQVGTTVQTAVQPATA